ncbi:MAG: hypothetical protein ACREU9_07480 [Gammaproteobacteria bacterium]
MSLSEDGDTVVVGAVLDDIGANSDQGSAYVFVKPAGGWSGLLTEAAHLTASDGAAFDEFGGSVAVSGDTVVVGAPFDGIDANASQGSAYVFGFAPPNSAPTIAAAPGGQCLSDTQGRINLSVGDLETPAGSLTLSGSSSNTNLVPNANIVFGGSGANRTLTITAAPKKSGTASITVSVSDGELTTTLVVTVKIGTNMNDTLIGTSGPDMLFGVNGTDILTGLADNDLLCGGNGDDTLNGNGGADALNGGNGNDILNGGDENDTLTGGLGADSFRGGAGTDTATDFTPSQGDTQDGTIP